MSSYALPARRAARRRRRARHRAALGGVLVSAAIVALIVLIPGTGSGRRPSHAGLTSGSSRGSRVQARARRLAAASSLTLSYAAAVRTVSGVLGYTSYVRVGTPRRREVALTFDDGPGPYTPKILRILARTHSPATFFVIGKSARLYPQYLRAEVRGGSAIGNHTETHPFMSLLSPASQRAQIVDASRAIHTDGVPYPTLWRPPYGSFNRETLAILHKLQMLAVLWTLDTSDYARPGVQRIEYAALSGVRPGAIILMHDGGGDRSQTVAALPHIISALRRRGFRLVTVSQLLVDDPPPHHQPLPQLLSGGG